MAVGQQECPRHGCGIACHVGSANGREQRRATQLRPGQRDIKYVGRRRVGDESHGETLRGGQRAAECKVESHVGAVVGGNNRELQRLVGIEQAIAGGA